jgi:hypothetical protein
MAFALGWVTQVTSGTLLPFQANRVDNTSKQVTYVGNFASAAEAFAAINQQIGRTLAWVQDVRGDGVLSYTGKMP